MPPFLIGTIHLTAIIRLHAKHPPQPAALNHRPYLNAQGEEPGPHGFHEKEPGPPRQVHQHPRLPTIHRERLLAQNMFPRLQRHSDVLIMVRMWGSDVYDIDLRIGN